MILEQENSYKKISKIHLKSNILNETNDKFNLADDVAPLFMPTKFSDSRWNSIKEYSNDCYKCYKQKSLCGIQANVFSSIKPLIYIFESYKNHETMTQITSVIQMLCSTNLDISRLRRVFLPIFQT